MSTVIVPGHPIPKVNWRVCYTVCYLDGHEESLCHNYFKTFQEADNAQLDVGFRLGVQRAWVETLTNERWVEASGNEEHLS
jgi:hypothetical protein